MNFMYGDAPLWDWTLILSMAKSVFPYTGTFQKMLDFPWFIEILISLWRHYHIIPSIVYVNNICFF